MGGYSSEYLISLKSGQVVYDQLDRTKYEPYKVHIFKEKWVLVLDNGIEYPIDKNDFSATINGEKITFDVVFNAIHGTPGEDGFLQAYFELIQLPITGCDFYQAALTFNKRDMLSVLKPYGIKTAISYFLNEGDPIIVEEIVNKVGLPCFVKPNRSGSSFGVSMVKQSEDLLTAIENAYKEDNEIIIESYLKGTEVSVGVILFKMKLKFFLLLKLFQKMTFLITKLSMKGNLKKSLLHAFLKKSN